MNFNTHKQQVIDLIEIALTKDKEDLIERFKIILNKSSSLLKSSKFDFWLVQLGSIPSNEIPITKLGLYEALHSVSNLQNLDRNSFESGILSICEELFTYSNDEDFCPLQTKYSYYFYLPANKVFKESRMGDCNLEEQKISFSDVRIAKISEIKAEKSEYL